MDELYLNGERGEGQLSIKLDEERGSQVKENLGNIAQFIRYDVQCTLLTVKVIV